MRNIIIVLISITMTACLNEASSEGSDIDKPYFPNELLAAKSPDGKRRLNLKEFGYDNRQYNLTMTNNSPK